MLRCNRDMKRFCNVNDIQLSKGDSGGKGKSQHGSFLVGATGRGDAGRLTSPPAVVKPDPVRGIIPQIAGRSW